MGMTADNKNSERDIIFMQTKDDVLACAKEFGISKQQVADDVIELVKSNVNLEFRYWLEKGILEEATKCPLGLVCYPSCFWWKDGKCIFPGEDK